MYADPSLPGLDSPPPRSHFPRRPWSPEAGEWRNVHMTSNFFSNHHGTSSGRRQQRQEASDVSVEALDLADYARTLRTRQAEDPYPQFPSHVAQPQPLYPPEALPYLPQLATSRDSIAMHPPSLVSPGPTLSSVATHLTSSASASSSAPRRAARRPYSLPPTPRNSSQASGSARNRPSNHHPYSRQVQDPYIVNPDVHPSTDEIDISNFPKWARGWYNSNHSSTKYPSRFEPDLEDIYTPIPPSRFNSSKNKSPFDPGYVHDPYNPYDIPPPFSSVAHDSARDLLPWSQDPPEYGPPVHPVLKEERMRMLEREFGTKGKGKDPGKSLYDDDGQPVVGTVDKRGHLVTSGPKRRIIFRVLEIVLAAGACVPAIYAAVAIKPASTPPPANKPPVFVLYVLSSLTLVVLLYMFLIRPCCVVRKPAPAGNPLMNKSMMILPVAGPGGKKGQKGGKKGKNKRGGPGSHGPGDVQVNLIVDPKAFQPPDADMSDEDDEDEDDSLGEAMPGGFGYDERERAKRKKRRRNQRRRGLMEGLRMEEEWKRARSWAKKVTAVDVFGLVLWGAAFVFIMIGQRCPSGGYDGWCNAYNVSTASSCLLAVAFGVSLFYDVQDLFASKQSPRTRN